MATTNYASRIIQPTFEQWLKYKVSPIRLSPLSAKGPGM